MYVHYKDGWIEVISGCMFAGKTEEFLRRINKLKVAKKQIQIFKPKTDIRYDKHSVVSHNGQQISAILIENANDLVDKVKDGTEVIAIDEIQFFDKPIVDILENFANNGKRVIVAGLDKDFRGEPFGVMPELLTRAEFVTKLSAICLVCGGPATRTQRIVNGQPANYDDEIVLIGAEDSYEARCRHCHKVANSPKTFIRKKR